LARHLFELVSKESKGTLAIGAVNTETVSTMPDYSSRPPSPLFTLRSVCLTALHCNILLVGACLSLQNAKQMSQNRAMMEA